MLVLTRKLRESIYMKIKLKDNTEKEVCIKVVDIGSKKIRLGIDADKDVIILREELLAKPLPAAQV